jgi:hypothetical protein
MLTDRADPMLIKGDLIIRIGAASVTIKHSGWVVGLIAGAIIVLACALGFGFFAYYVGAPLWGCMAASGVGLISAGGLIWGFTRLLPTSGKLRRRTRKRR